MVLTFKSTMSNRIEIFRRILNKVTRAIKIILSYLWVYGGYIFIFSTFYFFHICLEDKSELGILGFIFGIIPILLYCVIYHVVMYNIPADIMPLKDIRRIENILTFSITCMFLFQIFDIILLANEVYDFWLQPWIFEL